MLELAAFQVHYDSYLVAASDGELFSPGVLELPDQIFEQLVGRNLGCWLGLPKLKVPARVTRTCVVVPGVRESAAYASFVDFFIFEDHVNAFRPPPFDEELEILEGLLRVE